MPDVVCRKRRRKLSYTHITPYVEKLIAVVEGEMTRTELMDILSLKDRKHFNKDYLQPALEARLVEMTISDKPRSVKQKCRLTDLGRKLVTNAGKKA